MRKFFSLLKVSFNYQSRKWVLRTIIWLRWYWLVAWYCKYILLKTNHRSFSTNKPILLALCPERFRGDLEALEEEGTFGVIRCPTEMVYLLNALYLQNPDDENGNYHKEDYFDVKPGSKFEDQRKKLDSLYLKVLPILFEQFGIKAVLAPNFTMPQFDLLGVSASNLGYAYIVIHREGLIIAPGLVKRDRDWVKKAGVFPGDFLILHNTVQRDVLVESGYVVGNKAEALGCVRMDSLVSKLSECEPSNSNRTNVRRLVLFSFTPGQGLVGLSGYRAMSNFPDDRSSGFWDLFIHTHGVVGTIASENSDIEVIIKTKWKKKWFNEIELALKHYDLCSEKIRNLSIVDTGDAHDLILSSSVVTSYGSTTMIEAGIAGKPVVVPYFGEVSKLEYQPYIYFIDHMHLFDVAYSPDQFKERLRERLANDWTAPKPLLEARKEIFNQYVSQIDGGSLKRYVEKILSLVHD